MRSSRRARDRSQRGLTLLEVLAAVALLGVVFTALARSASVGVLAEGASRRLLEASLLADSRLAALELSASLGEVPELGVLEEEHEDFTVEIETLPWALPERLRSERELLIATPSEVFGDGTNADVGLVREVRLRVSWSDGVDERAVERTTWLVDFAALTGDPSLLLPGLLGGGLDPAAALEALSGEDGAETQP